MRIIKDTVTFKNIPIIKKIMEEFNISKTDVQNMIDIICEASDLIGSIKTKKFKLSEDFYAEYIRNIIYNILQLILKRVKETLKSENKTFANKSTFSKSFPNFTKIHSDKQLVIRLTQFFPDEGMNYLIRNKFKYDVEMFSVRNAVKYYSFSKEFMTTIREFMITKLIYFTNGIILIPNTTSLTANDIQKYLEISGTVERLIEGITGSFAQSRNIVQNKIRSPTKIRSPRKRSGRSPKAFKSPKNKGNNKSSEK